MTEFAGKTVLVTGAGGGIGRAIAHGFAHAGATVILTGRRPQPLADTVAAIEADGGRATAIPADLTRPDQVTALFDTIAGGLDVAVNNAGIAVAGRVGEVSEHDFARVVETNLTALWRCLAHEVNRMRDHGGGAIVNIASTIGAHLAVPGMGAYAASKAAVSALTRTAAREYIAEGIRINAVSPGPFDTPMSLRPGETEPDRATRIATALPIGRVGSLDEITETVLFLASPRSAFVVGHDLVLDGGATA